MCAFRCNSKHVRLSLLHHSNRLVGWPRHNSNELPNRRSCACDGYSNRGNPVRSCSRNLVMYAVAVIALAQGCRDPERSPQPAPQAAIVRSPRVSADVITYTVRESEQAVSKTPTSARARFKLGLAHYKQGNYQTAVIELLEAQRLDPKRLIIQYWLAYSYHAGGNPAAAAKVFERLVHAPMPDENLGEAYYRLGNYNWEMGKATEAARCYETALRRDPSLGPASYALGTIAARESRIDEARTYFETAVKHSKDGHGRAAAYTRLGELSEETGDRTSARASYSAALKAYAGLPEAISGIQRLDGR